MEESMFCDENGKPFPRTNKFDMELYSKELEKQSEENETVSKINSIYKNKIIVPLNNGKLYY